MNIIPYETELVDGNWEYYNENGYLEQLSTETALKGRSVILLTVPTNLQSSTTLQQLTGFAQYAKQLKRELGIDKIACISMVSVQAMHELMTKVKTKMSDASMFIPIPDWEEQLIANLKVKIIKSQSSAWAQREFDVMRSVTVLFHGKVVQKWVESDDKQCDCTSAYQVYEYLARQQAENAYTPNLFRTSLE